MLRSIAAASATPIQFNTKLHSPFKRHRPPLTILKRQFAPTNLTLTKTRNGSESNPHFPIASENDWEFLDEEIGGDGDDDGEGCPWEGAITYRRNAAALHLEYCTTLERLGMGKVSSEVSRSRASEMGLRVVGPAKDDGTPVLISVDVTRRKQKLRLDGIVRTVISLNCNRCGGPAAQSVYSDFSLLLCEEPIQEPETINFGTLFGEDKFKTRRMSEMDGDDDEDIDFDDRLYFPVDMKAIDISKNIRDLVHVEITITAICDPSCKGLCLKCGTNLNKGECVCNKHKKVEEKSHGPLRDLRKQMQT